MLSREDMGGYGEFFVKPSAGDRTPVGFLLSKVWVFGVLRLYKALSKIPLHGGIAAVPNDD